MKKRNVEIAIISDVHLGTYGSHATELLQYLKSIKPEVLIFNGDLIDFWAFKKSYWPKSHMDVLRYIVKMVSKGQQIYYLTGNHDDTLRKFTPFKLSNFEILDKLVLPINGAENLWVFHGDVFDASVNHSKWLAKLGGKGYDFLIRINRLSNRVLKAFGKQPYSFSKKIKESVKKSAKITGDYEQTAMDLALDKGYEYVALGHIHIPNIKTYTKGGRSTLYLNSGDWVENLTSLEYNNNQWTIYQHEKAAVPEAEEEVSSHEVTDLLQTI